MCSSHHKTFAVGGEGDKTYWTRVGSAWPHTDGKGWNIVLSALPVIRRIVLREYTAQDAAKEANEAPKKPR
jgi:hypothetical protein